jgi:hypothetical protein
MSPAKRIPHMLLCICSALSVQSFYNERFY